MKYFNIDISPILTQTQNNASCTLFDIDGIKMLFDCGWNETFSEDIAKIYNEYEYINYYFFRKITDKIDYIFLTNNNLGSMGGLPLILKMDNVKDAKIYATTPIAKLGFYILADAYISIMEMTDKFQTITDSDISSTFLNINEVKFKENVKLPHNNNEILITPLPSGTSLGGCCWKINYKLHSILYAPLISIDYKFICDPFPYEIIKNIDIVVTDSKCSNKISLVKTVIENEFKRNILESIEKGKNIFIPSDTANTNIELLIRLEKILDEFYFNKSKEAPSEKKESTYKVLLCGYSSAEVVESVKSLIEFLGSSISQQFYSYNDNPFNLQYVQCVKEVKEFENLKKVNNLIVISSFESLDTGFSYKILPEILPDPNFKIFIVNKSYKNSLLREVIKKVKAGVKEYNYKDIKRVLDSTNYGSTNGNFHVYPSQNLHLDSTKHTEIPHSYPINSYKVPHLPLDKDLNHIMNVEKILPITGHVPRQQLNESVNLNKLSFSDLSIKKKLFAKSPHPMFAYHQKKKINDYGIELTEKEIKLMKSTAEDKSEIFDSSFKAFLYTNNKTQETATKSDMRLKLKRQDLFAKAHFEENYKILQILAKFSFYDLFDVIDVTSKEFILTEIKPKNEIIFLGNNSNRNDLIPKILSKLKNVKCKILENFQKESIKFKNNLLNLKYDSTILNSLPSIFVKDYGYVYELENKFLKIKTKRKEIQEITITDAAEQQSDALSKFMSERNSEISSKSEKLDVFYTNKDLKLINLKRELTKLLNEEFFIFQNFITNATQDFKLFLEEKDLTLEGSLNPVYLKVRNCIYSNFINLGEI
jgi:Cft2 family RNA processing exonuclease